MTKPATKKPNPAVIKYATTAARTSLGDGMIPGVEVREDEELTVAYHQGAPFAAFWFDGDEIVYRFRRPDDDSKRDGVTEYYVELSRPKNWLEYRRPLSKDPKPNLVAKLAGVLGTTIFEITRGGKSLEPVTLEDIRAPNDAAAAPRASAASSIVSRGGPYIALPESRIAEYGGFEDRKSNELVLRAATDEGALADLPFGQALLLGTPDPLHWFPNDEGGLLVRVVSFDAEDEALVAQKVAALPDADFAEIEGELEAKEPWKIFDSALTGSAALEDSITLALAPGRYELSSRVAMGDDYEFAIVRLRRAR